MAILLVEQYYDFARALADQYLVMEACRQQHRHVLLTRDIKSLAKTIS